MNIFILDNDPARCAQMHADKHVVKMITESAQMLCTVLVLSGLEAPYRKTHANHPCTKWANSSLSNWIWLKTFTECLHEEYRHRYGIHKQHKAAMIARELANPNIVDIGLTPFAQAMPDQYKSTDPVQAYRNYYNGEKQHLFSFSNREKPFWIVEE